MIKKLQLVLQPSWSLKLPTRAYNNNNTINSKQYTKSRLYSPAVKSDNLHLISAFYATCVIAILCDVHVYQAQIFTAQSMCIEQYMPQPTSFLARSRSRSPYAVASPPVCHMSVVCNVRAAYSAGYVSVPFCALDICWHPRKILRRSSQRNPSVKGFKPNIAILNPSKTISQKKCKIGGKLVLMTNRKSYIYELSIGTKIGEWPWMA